jgi:MarR family 2-MHQ and catechol resistance regulon transcriptional repressor
MGTHYKGKEGERRALDAYIKLMRAAGALTSRLSPAFSEYGLTGTQFAVLEALHHVGPMCLGELAEKILVTGGNVTMVAGNLEKRGLIRRVPQQKDRRFVLAELTPAGTRLIERIFPIHLERLLREMDALSHAQQEELAKLCKKLGKSAAADDLTAGRKGICLAGERRK